MKPTFTGTVDGGALTIYKRPAFDRFLATLNGKVEISVKPWKNDRSVSQNRYYFGVIIKIISDETGYTLDETHQILKGMFLSTGKTVNGVPLVKSTSKLKVDEFEEYLETIRRWASVERGWYLPDPNEQ